MPFHIFRVRTVAGANVVGPLLGAVIFANFFLLTLYVQNVLGYSALKTGVTFVATAGTAVLAAGAAQALTTRFGPKPIIVIGLTLLTAGMIWYSQIPVHGSFVSDLLPGYLMVGVGIAFAFVPVSIAALAGVVEREAGLASGLINTSQQIGGAIGTAVASTIFTTHFKSLLQRRQVPAGGADRRLRLGLLGAGRVRRARAHCGAHPGPPRGHVRGARGGARSLDLRAQCFRHGVVHGEVPVEPGDLQRTPRLEAGRREQERAAVVELRPRLDQDAERGRVDELDLAEIHDDPLRRVGTGPGQRGAHLSAL